MMMLSSLNVSVFPYCNNDCLNPTFLTCLALPSGRSGDVTGILCNFEDFGTSMGMYINETAVMCITPHIQGRPEDYSRETVQVTVAMNGQDFNEIDSDAYVTFVGTGSDSNLLKILILVLLLALLIVSIWLCWAARGAGLVN